MSYNAKDSGFIWQQKALGMDTYFASSFLTTIQQIHCAFGISCIASRCLRILWSMAAFSTSRDNNIVCTDYKIGCKNISTYPSTSLFPFQSKHTHA